MKKILFSLGCLFLLPKAAFSAFEITPKNIDPAFVQHVYDLLPPGKEADPRFLDYQVNPNIKLYQEADIELTFIDEGAGYLNIFGYFLYEDKNKDGKMTEDEILKREVIFENASKEGSGGNLHSGDTVQLGKFPKGTQMGFYVVANGAQQSSIIQNPLWNFYTIDSLNPDSKRHLAMIADEEKENIILGIEDVLWEQSDHDFNDVIFTFTTNPKSAIKEVIENNNIPTPSSPPLPPAPEKNPNPENKPISQEKPVLTPSPILPAASAPASFTVEGSGRGCSMSSNNSCASFLSFLCFAPFLFITIFKMCIQSTKN